MGLRLDFNIILYANSTKCNSTYCNSTFCVSTFCNSTYRENLLIIVLGKNAMPKMRNLEKMVFFKLDLYQTYKKYVYKFKASLIFLNFLNFHIFLDTSWNEMSRGNVWKNLIFLKKMHDLVHITSFSYD